MIAFEQICHLLSFFEANLEFSYNISNMLGVLANLNNLPVFYANLDFLFVLRSC